MWRPSHLATRCLFGALRATGIQVVAYEDEASGSLELRSDGGGRFTEVTPNEPSRSLPGQLGMLARHMGDAGVHIEVLHSDHEHQLIQVVDDYDRGRAASAAWTNERA